MIRKRFFKSAENWAASSLWVTWNCTDSGGTMRFYNMVGACAARSERVQRGQSVCSEVGACAARFHKKYFDFTHKKLSWSVCSEVGACAARLERVQRGRSVCSEVCIYKRALSPHYRYNFMLVVAI